MTRVQTPLNRLAVASGETLAWGARTYVIGIINLTPDSFSGDGLGSDVYGLFSYTHLTLPTTPYV